MGRRVQFRDVLAVGEFRAMWTAELLSIAGDQLARLALAVLVYERTSSAAWTALAYSLTFVPAVLGGVTLSGLADRYPRRTVLIVTDVVRAVLVGLMVVPALSWPVLLGLVFLVSLVGAPAKAAQLALLRQILEGERYSASVKLRTITTQAAQLAGFLGGGAVLLVLTPQVVLAVNAATFAAAAVLVATGVAWRPAPAAPGPDEESRRAWSLVWQDRRLRGWFAVAWLAGFFVVPEGLAAPYAAGFGGTALAVGVLMAADPAGSVIGAWVVNRWVPLRLQEKMIVPMAVGAGLPLLVCLTRPGLVVSAVLWAVSGAFSSTYLMYVQESVTNRIPDYRRGAVMGLATSGLYTSQGLAVLVAGAVAVLIGPERTVAASGCVGAGLAAVFGVLWLRDRRDSEPGGRGADGLVRSPCSASPAPPPTEPAVGDPDPVAADASASATRPGPGAWTP